MCLILFAVDRPPRYRLVLAANRDEFYARPTRTADFWPDHPQLLAGYDLQARGTWLGITRDGRMAAVTNIRDGLAEKRPGQRSRGLLTRDFLLGDDSPQAYLQRLRKQRRQYPGFNLLLGDSAGFWFYNNEEDSVTPLGPGVYGLSNGSLDSPWPKLLRGKEQLRRWLERPDATAEQLLETLKDPYQPTDSALPDTGVPHDWERLLAPCFIRSERYGTRASSVLLYGHGGDVDFLEQNYDAQGEGIRNRFQFDTAS